MHSILLVRTSAIGDVVQTFPVVEYLRAQFPKAKIDWVVDRASAPLLMQLKGESGHLIDGVIEVELKAWAKTFWLKASRQAFQKFVQRLRRRRYDVVFDLQGNSKSALITLLARAKDKVGFGWRSVREKPNLLATSKRFNFPSDCNIREKYLQLAQSYYGDTTSFASRGVCFQLTVIEEERLKSLMKKPPMQHPLKLMVAVGSKWKNKKLGDGALIALLKEAQAHADAALILIYGNEEEKFYAERLLLLFPRHAMAVGELTLPLWQSLMQRVDGIIAVDSAALHFAGTTQTPSFSFFGPTSAHIFKPLGERHQAHQGTCPYGKAFDKQCPALRSCATGACMQDMDFKSFRAKFCHWLNSLQARP